MNDHHANAYAAEGVVWSRLAGLLPDAEDVDEVQACWDIGEQEGGLEVLVDRLLQQQLTVGESARAELAVMAEQWDVWDHLGAGIAALPCGAGQPARLRVFEDGAQGTTPLRDVLPRHPSTGAVLVPWVTCAPCGRVLARVHEWEEWGALSHRAQAYVVFSPDGSGAPLEFDADEGEAAAWSALEALRAGCGVRS
ncbi:hypothetical protein OHT76_33675 [Streptomyces sp. NBC_00287]|uniref:hypothetical protein n=1 Tax=Streptomyces sp. NBC_00287 TaxID=2975702 RepID=UPI002E2889E0|nr:hypothetical protein [Streptomyces sp. NBC_00287]